MHLLCRHGRVQWVDASSRRVWSQKVRRLRKHAWIFAWTFIRRVIVRHISSISRTYPIIPTWMKTLVLVWKNVLYTYCMHSRVVNFAFIIEIFKTFYGRAFLVVRQTLNDKKIRDCYFLYVSPLLSNATTSKYIIYSFTWWKLHEAQLRSNF